MTRFLAATVHNVTVVAITLTVTWTTALCTNSSLLTIAAGATAAWLAGAFLPCPCHRRGGQR